MSTAERNRALKKTIEQAFGRGNVTVKGSRGTAYGWATVRIAYAPRNRRERQELEAQVWQLIRAAKIEIDTYGYDSFGSKLHINFEDCREKADYYGPDAWRQNLTAAEWDRVQAEA